MALLAERGLTSAIKAIAAHHHVPGKNAILMAAGGAAVIVVLRLCARTTSASVRSAKCNAAMFAARLGRSATW